MDLSIIVPVYNVEKYVRTCIESIYRQGLDESRFELIIVNDGTKDHSMEMITDIIQQHSNLQMGNDEIDAFLSSPVRNSKEYVVFERLTGEDFLLQPRDEQLLCGLSCAEALSAG